MRARVLMAVTALLAVGLYPLTASAHQSCVTDAAGDAAVGYDIQEMCVSGGDEDPVEFTAGIADPAADLGLTWTTDGWSVRTDVEGTTTVVVAGQPVDCDGAATLVSDTGLFTALVPASCLPVGEAAVTAMSSDAEGALLDQTDPAVTGVPQSDDSGAADGDGHGEGHGEGHGGDMGFTRLSGGSRIETAVAISADSYPDGAPAVLLANADNPVDALPASRSAYDGPILYVPSCGDLPTVVAEEIARLAPADVIVLGGTGAICDDMGMQAVAASGVDAPADRVQGTPDPAATPADEVLTEDVRTAAFTLLDTRPAEGYESAAGEAAIAREADLVTVTVRVTGLLPDTQYNSHVHAGSCADGGGEHFMFDPDGGDTPPNEIHLPFTTDADGTAIQTSTHTTVPGEDARSIVVHPRDNGPARVMCAEWSAVS